MKNTAKKLILATICVTVASSGAFADRNWSKAAIEAFDASATACVERVNPACLVFDSELRCPKGTKVDRTAMKQCKQKAAKAAYATYRRKK